MQKFTAAQPGGAFVPTAGDLSAKGAEQFEVDRRVRGKPVTREQFTAEWMAQAIRLRAWTWFDVQTSATLEALYGKRGRALPADDRAAPDTTCLAGRRRPEPASVPRYGIRRPAAAAGASAGKKVSHPMGPRTPTRAGRIVRRSPRLVELSGTASRAEDTTTWTAVALDDRPPVARRPPCGRCRGTGFVYLWSVDNRGASVWFCDRCKCQWAEPASAPAIADGRSDRAAVGGGAAAPVVSERPAAPACERCGGASVRIVSLVDADMAQGDHALCDPCWAYLVEGLQLRQPWVRSPDPRALYLTTTRAWELMDEAAAQPA